METRAYLLLKSFVVALSASIPVGTPEEFFPALECTRDIISSWADSIRVANARYGHATPAPDPADSAPDASAASAASAAPVGSTAPSGNDATAALVGVGILILFAGLAAIAFVRRKNAPDPLPPSNPPPSAPPAAPEPSLPAEPPAPPSPDAPPPPPPASPANSCLPKIAGFIAAVIAYALARACISSF